MRRYRRHISITTILILVLLAAYYVYTTRQGIPTTGLGTSQPQTPAAGVNLSTPGVPVWGHQSKTSGCRGPAGLPDSACTPGDILTNVSPADICKSGYAKSVRNVTESEKQDVYAEYGIASRSPGEYEVDHLVSLELGGSNDISNLWPEPASPTPGFHEKDQVENYLHDQVCSGKIGLSAAQTQIATNWLAVYNNMPK